jgi:hypothetical protein
MLRRTAGAHRHTGCLPDSLHTDTDRGADEHTDKPLELLAAERAARSDRPGLGVDGAQRGRNRAPREPPRTGSPLLRRALLAASGAGASAARVGAAA